MTCSYCGQQDIDPAGRYTSTSETTETITEQKICCKKPECVKTFFTELREKGLLNPETWDSVEFARNI